MIPLRDTKGKLWSYQKIYPDNRVQDKIFLKNGRVTGLFHTIGEPTPTRIIAEGYATAASLHESTGYCVHIAFNCHNLKSVTEAIRKKYPDANLIIAADDDHMTNGNPGLSKAKEAAIEFGGALAVPDFGESRGSNDTDFNDLHQLKGAFAVRIGIELNRLNPQNLVKQKDLALLAHLVSNWEADPEPVIPITKPQTPFPIESLPPMIREAVIETLDYTQVPVGLACSSALGVAAASVQHLALVARDHQTIGPVSLYVLSILKSGERKSTILRKMWKCIWEMQRELKEQWDHYQVQEHDEVNPVFDRDSPPKILFEDATVQGLALEIESGIRSVLMSSSEGGTVFGGIGMRGEALMGALAFLNKAWDAEAQSMTRKQAVSTYLEFYRLSCLISSQRETIQEWLKKNPGLAEGMGFLARFLICVPESTIGYRVYKQAPDATPKLDRFTEQCLKRLRQKTNLVNPPILYLGDDAHRYWVEYFNFVEAAQGKNGPYEYHTAAASKSAEQAARISGVFTLFSEDNPKEVGIEAIQQGIKIAKWFLDESLRLSGHLTISRVHSHAEMLLEWLRELELDDENPLKVGDILQIGPRPIRRKKERDEAIKVLSELGWIQVAKWKNRRIILLHPSISKK